MIYIITMSEEDNKEYGSIEDIQKIMEETERVEVEYKGKYYWFEYKNKIPYKEKTDIIVSNYKGEFDEDMDDFSGEDVAAGSLTTDLLREYIVDSNVSSINTFLAIGPDDMIEELDNVILGDDVVNINEENEGK